MKDRKNQEFKFLQTIFNQRLVILELVESLATYQ